MSILDLLFLNFWMTGFSLVVLPTSLWVLVDATTLKVKKGKLGGGVFDMGVAGWFFSCLLLWIVAFPGYLAKRGEYKRLKDGKTNTLTDLQTLADLRDRGVLTAEEFEAKKAELLKRI
jgi:hypothetical protein